MQCLFCGWEMGMGGTVDPCEVVLAFEDHIHEHMLEMVGDAYVRWNPDV